MSFTARIQIQGVGVYVPQIDEKRWLVLFPDHEKATQRGIRDIAGEAIRDHHAAVQMRSSALGLDPSLDQWTTFDVAGSWIRFESDSAVEINFPAGGLPGLPHLSDVMGKDDLDDFVGLDEEVFPGGARTAELLKAGLIVDAGVISPNTDYQGKFTIFGAGDRDLDLTRDYASVMKVELGEVEELTLELESFETGQTSRLEIKPTTDEIDVWVRHFCDLAKPDPSHRIPARDQPDYDFALNYALCRDLDGLVLQRGNRLPVPKVWKSWAHGGPIGGDPRMCMGSQQP